MEAKPPDPPASADAALSWGTFRDAEMAASLRGSRSALFRTMYQSSYESPPLFAQGMPLTATLHEVEKPSEGVAFSAP